MDTAPDKPKRSSAPMASNNSNIAQIQDPAKVQRLDIILFGNTGSGKSATMKSITGEIHPEVNIRGGWDTVTAKNQRSEVVFEGKQIFVFDSLCTHSIQGTNTTNDNIAKAMQEVPYGFNAFLLVFSYGKRFGVEDRMIVDDLKIILGPDWLTSHGVVVMTGADNFKRDFEDEDITSEDWFKQQPGFLKEVLIECNYRAVFFDNITTDCSTQTSQLRQLLAVIDGIGNTQARYKSAASRKTPKVKNGWFWNKKWPSF